MAAAGTTEIELLESTQQLKHFDMRELLKQLKQFILCFWGSSSSLFQFMLAFIYQFVLVFDSFVILIHLL